MSMSTSITYGIGSKITESNKIADFIRNHRETLYAIQNSLTAHRPANILDYYNLLEDVDADEPMSSDELYVKYDELESACDSCTTGLPAVISDVISIENDIRVMFLEEQDEPVKYIMFAEALPWQYNDKEKALTQESLTGIFKKYFDELEIPLDMDYIQVEYFG